MWMAILAIAQEGKSPMQNSKARLFHILKNVESPVFMTTMLHLANFTMQEESLMKILEKQDATSMKSVKRLLLNIMLAKAIGPISGKTLMLLYVEYCSNMALFPLITMTSKTSTRPIVSMKFASKEKAPMMKS